MSTSQKVKGEGVNQIEAKNNLNKYKIVVKSGDSGNTNVTEPFVESNN